MLIMGAFVCAYTYRLFICFAFVFVFFSQLTIANSGRGGMINDGWWILPMSSKMQLTGCSGASWLLWTVQNTYLDIVFPLCDIPFPVDNYQLVCKLSIPKRRWLIQMSSKKQLTGSSRRHDDSEWFKCQTLTLPCPNMTYPSLFANTDTVLPDKWGIPQMSSKMQLTSCSRAMDEKIHVGFFSRRFSHMQRTIWEWNVKKLEGGGS